MAKVLRWTTIGTNDFEVCNANRISAKYRFYAADAGTCAAPLSNANASFKCIEVSIVPFYRQIRFEMIMVMFQFLLRSLFHNGVLGIFVKKRSIIITYTRYIPYTQLYTRYFPYNYAECRRLTCRNFGSVNGIDKLKTSPLEICSFLLHRISNIFASPFICLRLFVRVIVYLPRTESQLRYSKCHRAIFSCNQNGQC